METRILTASDVQALLDMPSVIEAVEGALAAHGRGRVSMPPKFPLDVARFGPDTWFHALPAYLPDLSLCGIKWAAGNESNSRERALPYIVSTITLNDPDSGVPLAIMDGTVLTSMRTGAAAAVAVKYLASTLDVRLAVIGAGAVGLQSANAIACVARLRELRIYDIDAVKAEALVRAVPVNGAEVSIAASAEEAVTNAEVVVTATYADEPLFSPNAVAAGALITAMGSKPEVPPGTVRSADLVVVDHKQQNVQRGQLAPLLADGSLPPGDLVEIGDMIAGHHKGRSTPGDVIVAALLGVASTDIAVGAVLLSRARAQNRGMVVDLLA
jgi:alanine dehydrogenase